MDHGFDAPQIRILTSTMHWSVVGAVNYLSTTGAARYDQAVLPALGRDLTDVLGEAPTDWHWDWRLAALRLNA